MKFNRSFEIEVAAMPLEIDKKISSRSASGGAPFSAHRVIRAKSRSILMNAVACFVATALGSLVPHAPDLFEAVASKPLSANVDPESGKFTDRVLVGGLQPIAWEEDRAVAPAPAFAMMPILPGSAESAAFSHPKAAIAPTKPLKETAPKRAERAAESRSAEAIPAPSPVASGPALEPKSEEPGVLASLTPSAVSAKLAQKVWSGARSVGSAVSGGLSWLGY
jgi:hypothetical protein